MCKALIISNDSVNDSITKILGAAFATLSIIQKKVEDDFTPYSLVILKLGYYNWFEKIVNLSLTELKAIQYCYHNNLPIYISYVRSTRKDMNLFRISTKGDKLVAIQGSGFPSVNIDNYFHISSGTIFKNLFCINTIEDRINMLEEENFTNNPGMKVDETPLKDPTRIQYLSKEKTLGNICTTDSITQKRDKRLLM